MNKLLSLSVEIEIDNSEIARASTSKIPAKLEERLFSQIDSINTPRLLLGQETLYTNSNNSKLQTLASNFKRYSPLQPREAFVGWRTANCVTKWPRTLENKSICFVDVCSLFPYMNSRCPYMCSFWHPDEISLATEQRCQTPYQDSVDSDRHLSNHEQSSGGGTKPRPDICYSDGPTNFFS